MITQQVVRDEVGRRLQMTQAQEQAYYDAHKQEFEQPEQVRLSEILVPHAGRCDRCAGCSRRRRRRTRWRRR